MGSTQSCIGQTCTPRDGQCHFETTRSSDLARIREEIWPKVEPIWRKNGKVGECKMLDARLTLQETIHCRINDETPVQILELEGIF